MVPCTTVGVDDTRYAAATGDDDARAPELASRGGRVTQTQKLYVQGIKIYIQQRRRPASAPVQRESVSQSRYPRIAYANMHARRPTYIAFCAAVTRVGHGLRPSTHAPRPAPRPAPAARTIGIQGAPRPFVHAGGPAGVECACRPPRGYGAAALQLSHRAPRTQQASPPAPRRAVRMHTIPDVRAHASHVGRGACGSIARTGRRICSLPPNREIGSRTRGVERTPLPQICISIAWQHGHIRAGRFHNRTSDRLMGGRIQTPRVRLAATDCQHDQPPVSSHATTRPGAERACVCSGVLLACPALARPNRKETTKKGLCSH